MARNKLAQYIKSKGLTLTDVASNAGISRQSLSQYGGEFCPKFKTINRIALSMTNLGVPTDGKELFSIIFEESK